MSGLSYPTFRKDDVVDDWHGVAVADPFRYLEDPDGAETVAFVTAQNEVTGAYFARSRSERDAVRARLDEVQNYGRVGCPMTRGGRHFVFRNRGLQNQDVMYRVESGAVAGDSHAPVDLFDTPSLAVPFLDLNAEFPDGTTSLGSSSFSEDGSRFAYGLQRGGSDWQTLYVRDVSTGVNSEVDVVKWTKFSRISWLHDGSGFFYARHPAPVTVANAEDGKAGTETAATNYAMVFFHRVGTPQEADVLVYANPAEPVWRYGPEISDDGEYLLLTTHKGTDPVNRMYYAHLPTVWAAWVAAAAPYVPAPGASPPTHDAYAYLPMVRVVDNFSAEFGYLTNDGARFYLKTNLDAPRYRVVAVDFPPTAPPGTGAPTAAVEGATPAVWDVIPHHDKDVLDWASVVGQRHLVLCYMRDVVNAVQTVLLPSTPPALPPPGVATPGPSPTLLRPCFDVPLPSPCTVAGFSGRKEQFVAWVKVVSPLLPGSIFRLTFPPTEALPATAEEGGYPAPTLTNWYDIDVPGFDASSFAAEQVFVPSYDGAVRIPMFIVGKRLAGPRVPRPTLLYGYGGFNISLQPTFSAARLVWLNELGGVYALACIRGGGEYGEEWHAAGSKHQKQNCFDDFAACAEYLVRMGMTTHRQIGIMGGSNGGLLTLASALQRPHFFGAAVSQVPVADMLRFHKFTVGALWRGEYGFAEDSKADFDNMYKYSPLHNVKPITDPAAQLPSILITTADHDDRVVPLHSLKMIATLQDVAGRCAAQTRPLLARIETKAGHGAGKPTAKVLDEFADIYTFLSRELGDASGGAGASGSDAASIKEGAAAAT